MSANEKQVGGSHYKVAGEEHWDRVHRLGLDYFQGQITKYVERCWKKNGIEDLKKARHFIDKYIELCEPKNAEDFHPEKVRATGWVDFVYEGGSLDFDLFTCRKCRTEVRVPPFTDPNIEHQCAGKSYVNQD